LLNQYSLSEYAGTLRIATTFTSPGACCDQPGKSESMITVLRRNGDGLVAVGKLGGLGVGERIYAARFIARSAIWSPSGRPTHCTQWTYRIRRNRDWPVN